MRNIFLNVVLWIEKSNVNLFKYVQQIFTLNTAWRNPQLRISKAEDSLRDREET